jgi:5,6-dimethylbenzimidazole synthase
MVLKAQIIETGPRFDAGFRERLRELLKWRRDVRRFKRDPLPNGSIERLIEIACLSPSVGLSEPWRFVIVEDKTKRAGIRANFGLCNADALKQQTPDHAGLYARLKLAGLDDAPVQLSVFADPSTLQGAGLGRLTMPETINYSVTMAIHTLWLVARAEGLGMGWVSIIDPASMSKILDVPAEWVFVGHLCIGYPEADADRPVLETEGWEKRRSPEARILYR